VLDRQWLIGSDRLVPDSTTKRLQLGRNAQAISLLGARSCEFASDAIGDPLLVNARGV
jgi:hypothetical protein